MLKFSQDGPTADKQMRAVIFYLTTFGYIDGDFDQAEKEFVRNYVRKLVESRVNDAVPESDQKLRSELTLKFTAHFHEVFIRFIRKTSSKKCARPCLRNRIYW